MIRTIIVSLVIVAAYHTLFASVGGLGAVSFPTSLDTFTNPSATDRTSVVSHASQHADANDAIEALQAKVGADGSSVNTTHDFKLSGVADGDYAASIDGTETLTNKTLISPSLTGLNATTSIFWESTILYGTTTIDTTGPFSLDLGSDATGDVYYRNSSGEFVRLGIGSNGQFLKVSSGGLPEWNTSASTIDVDNYFATSTGDSTVSGISVDADDELIMWATFDEKDANCNTGSSEDVTGSLVYSFGAGASTTVFTSSDGTGAAGEGCHSAVNGMVTATTATTFHANADLSDGDYTSLIVQHWIK